MTDLPPHVLDHLVALTGRHGLYEHALHEQPRPGHGYTTDDNARALVVLRPDVIPADEAAPYLEFVLRGRVPGGWHNRMDATGRWLDARGSEDAHGRALWGLGSALPDHDPERILPVLRPGLDLDTPHPRSNAYAVLGAVAVLQAMPDEVEFEEFLRRVSTLLPGPTVGPWKWPAPRLTYDNARIPEALIAAGSTLGVPRMVDDGLTLLSWLIDTERGTSGFSFTSVGGKGPGERGPGFDQQPIEAWAMADACSRANQIRPDNKWERGLEDAAFWFLGRNDTGVDLYDRETGAGFDGLQARGVNQNRGAESTLAALGALRALHQHRKAIVG